MSSYKVDDSTINGILSFFRFCNNYSGARYDVITSMVKWQLVESRLCGDFCGLGQQMSEMNDAALAARYGDTEPEWVYEHDYAAPPTPIQAYKSLKCFLYQCNEGGVPDMVLYQALSSVAATLAEGIVQGMAEYDKANWG